jgi:hypothetical protein
VGGINTYGYVPDNSTKGIDGYTNSQRIKLNPTRKARLLASFASKFFKSMFNRLFPIGYEDDQGFHFGRQNGQLQERRSGKQSSDGNKR